MQIRAWNYPLFVPAFFAGLKLALHLFVNAFAGFGYFRDELYYIVSTDHLAAGFVDHPPLSIYLLAVSNLIFGESLFAVRLLPAVASAAVVFFVGLMAKELGGGRTAQTLACLASSVWLFLLAVAGIYSMNVFDMLFWTLALLQTVRLTRELTTRNWILLGVILGLGLFNKIGVLWLGAGLAAGILLTPLRNELRRPGPWLAGLTALAIFSPYIIWNAANDWPHLEFIRNATSMKYGGVTAADFLIGQFLIQNPVTAPLWIAGLIFFFLRRNAPLRVIGIAYVVCVVILTLNGHSKPEYLSAFYGILFAGGAVSFENFTGRWSRTLVRRVYSVVLASGVVFVPAILPVLPVDSTIAWMKTLSIQPVTAEGHQLEELPQFFADMFGWEEVAHSVAEVYRSLPPEEQATVGIYAQNYGQASAITFFGKYLGLPPAISGHNSYFLWGPGDIKGNVVIIYGGDQEDHEQNFETVIRAATHTAEYAMPYENNVPIYVCRRLKHPLGAVWPMVKNYI